MRFLPSTLSLLGGATLGVVLSVSLPASATRNSVGTYTLPSGNPVVSGTTISSTWANNTLGDLAVEMTNSLDRQGRGAMLAPLRLQAGTAGAPALTFSVDPDTGLYRAGNDDIRFQVDGAQSLQLNSGGVYVPGTAAVGVLEVDSTSSFTGDADFGGDVSVSGVSTLGIVDVNGVSTFAQPATLNSGGPSLVLKPGAADHVYAEYYADTGAPSTRSGFTGYSSAGTPHFSITNSMTGGDLILTTPGEIVASSAIQLDGTTPTSSAAFSNAVTRKNVVKAWARLRAPGSGSTTVMVEEGFNVSGASVHSGTGFIDLNLATPMSDGNYSVFVTGGSRFMSCGVELTALSLVRVGCKDLSSTISPLPDINFQINTLAVLSRIHVVVLGAQ